MASLKRNKIINSSFELIENTLDTVNESLLTFHDSLVNYRSELNATAPIQLQTSVAEHIIDFNKLLKDNIEYLDGIPDLDISHLNNNNSNNNKITL